MTPPVGKRSPRKLGDVVANLMARRGYGREAGSAQFDEAWSKVAGFQAAKKTRVGNLRKGVLEIVVNNSTTLQELTFVKQQLLDQLVHETSGASIHELRFRVGMVD